MKVVYREQMVRIEQEADAGGLSFATMMENAGKALADVIVSRFAPVEAVRILVLIGPGNNGGDGLVAARHLTKAGAHVHLYLLNPRPEDDPNWSQCQKLGIPFTLADSDSGGNLRRLLSRSHGVVDALLGTGATRSIQGELKAVLEVVAAERAGREVQREKHVSLCRVSPGAAPSPWVVAVDLPSGMDCDTGAVDPVTLPADLTVTFAYPKLGHFLFPGGGYTGELVVADIAIPPSLAEDVGIEVATPERVRGILPARPMDAHKGTFGKALVVAGSVNYTGAAYLAGAAATRAGAGLVTLAVPGAIHPIVASKLTETTYIVLPHEMGVIAEDAHSLIAETGTEYDALLVGPGLGREDTTGRFIRRLVRGEVTRQRSHMGFVRASEEGGDGSGSEPHSLPMIVDADGLNLLSEEPEWWKPLSEGNVLTPHPGEMARLMNLKVEDIQADRLTMTREAAKLWGQVVVLKGAYTVVGSPEGRVTINPFANPGLASAGTGDILAGIIVGLLAQGVAPCDAAVAGAFIHGMAGQRVAERCGDMGMVAGDLLDAIPQALRDLRGNVAGPQS